jgi:hypothetical protein
VLLAADLAFKYNRHPEHVPLVQRSGAFGHSGRSRARVDCTATRTAEVEQIKRYPQRILLLHHAGNAGHGRARKHKARATCTNGQAGSLGNPAKEATSLRCTRTTHQVRAQGICT